MNTLHDLFVLKIQDLYDAENQITEALPKMKDAATNEMLKTGFEKHLEETRAQINRLEEVAKNLNIELGGKENVVMKTMIAEGEKMMTKGGDPNVMDAFLIAAGQKVEHYEIASYGAAAAWAKAMEHEEEADLLGKTLDEEIATDKKLSSLAEGGILKSGINEKATE